MPRNLGMPLAFRDRLDPEGLVPDNMTDDNGADVATQGYIERTVQAPLAPLSEMRMMIADRAHVRWTPGYQAAESDSNKGGVPGQSTANMANDPQGSTISSQDVDGTTTFGTAPVSTLKISYGFADWASVNPQPIPAHGKINLRANPNDVKTKPGIWQEMTPWQNTNYEQPAPWAAGIYIG